MGYHAEFICAEADSPICLPMCSRLGSRQTIATGEYHGTDSKFPHPVVCWLSAGVRPYNYLEWANKEVYMAPLSLLLLLLLILLSLFLLLSIHDKHNN